MDHTESKTQKAAQGNPDIRLETLNKLFLNKLEKLKESMSRKL